jgi:AraC-like DNA-binding protein
VIEADPTMPASIGRWCRIARVGRTRLHWLFRKHLGSAPAAWMHRQRIARACPRLLRGERITRIALDLGYASSQHFARTFKALVGSTPTGWRDRQQRG